MAPRGIDMFSAIEPRILVLAPLAEEWSILVKACEERHQTETLPDLRLPCAYVPAWRMVLARAGHGKTQCAVQAQYLIGRFPSASLVVCAGSAGLSGFRIAFDVIASGDEDVVSSSRAAEIRTQTSAVCVAWEGSGAARAAAFNNIGSLEIRGITDAADKEAPQDFHDNLPVAMANLFRLLEVLPTMES